MLYHIKPEYLDLWGSDATEETIIDESTIEMCARGLEKSVDEIIDQLEPIENDKTSGGIVMDKKAFVTHIIQHTEDYPNTSEITLEAAQQIINNLDLNEPSIPDITPEDLRDLWNELVHDPEVMTLE